MAKMELEVTITFAWWWRPYVALLVWAAVLSGREPCPDRLARVCTRAMRVKLGPGHDR